MISSFFWPTLLGLLFLSAFLSGTETGLYRLSRLRLRLGIEQKRISFKFLDRLVSDTTGVIFSILIGNNLVNYLATSLVIYALLPHVAKPETAEFYATLIMVPVLFVLGDLIPKNIYFYLADRVMPLSAPLMYAIHKVFVFTGIVPLLKFISSALARLGRIPPEVGQAVSPTHRQYIRQIIHDTREEGILSTTQTEIIERLVNIPSIHAGSVMVPLDKVLMIPFTADRQLLLDRLKAAHFRNYPVFKTSRTEIHGYVNIYEVLLSKEQPASLEHLIKPLERVSSSVPIIELLNRMRNENLEMVLVFRADRASQVPIGIITIKDLVEELIGELSQW